MKVGSFVAIFVLAVMLGAMLGPTGTVFAASGKTIVLATIKGKPSVSCDILALKYGKRASGVYLVQSILSSLGYYPRSLISDFYGATMHAALMRFQKTQHTKVTGNMDAATVTALQKVLPKYYKECAPVATVPLATAPSVKAAPSVGSITATSTPTSTPVSTLPDLIVENLFLSTSTPAVVGGPIGVVYDVVNIGDGDAPRDSWIDSIYLSPHLEPGQFEMLRQDNSCGGLPVLRKGKACEAVQEMKINVPGVYTLTVSTDDQHWLKESDESNNKRSIVITIGKLSMWHVGRAVDQ